MKKTMTAVAAAMIALSGVAQADTIKQIWNQGLGEDNPGRVISASDCLQDDFSRFGCWHERDVAAPAPAAAAEEEPDEPVDPEPNGPTDQPPT